jgi:ClpX C4-type zinc finger
MGMDETRCSFCNKPATALIKAPNAAAPNATASNATAPNAVPPKGHGGVYICTECVRACAAILDSDDDASLLAIRKETVQ